MPNYENSKIYKLWSPSKNLVYIGSTTKTLSQRLGQHLCSYKKNKGLNSQVIIECEDYKIELLEEYPCNNRQQLCKKEGEYIKNNECINKIISGRTKIEWREDNKEKIKQYNIEYTKTHKEQSKKYYENNKEQLTEYYKNYYEANKEKRKAYDKKRYEQVKLLNK